MNEIQSFNNSLDAAHYALSYRRLGDLYEEQGDTGKAVTYYSKFVNLWAKADPDLQPKVADVRARLKRLARPSAANAQLRIYQEAGVSETSRRAFLSTLGALAGAAVVPGVIEGQAAQQGGGWDMSWLDRLTGKHRQVFDFTNPQMLQVMRNWLDAHELVYGLKHPEVSAVVGIGSPSFPVNATDAMYEKYPIGVEWKITDPDTGKPAMRNIFLDGSGSADERENSVRALQRRGVIFWQCNNALKRVATQIANAVKRPQPEVYADLRASGLNPGVILVPAHTMLIGLCQERGCAYEKI